MQAIHAKTNITLSSQKKKKMDKPFSGTETIALLFPQPVEEHYPRIQLPVSCLLGTVIVALNGY